MKLENTGWQKRAMRAAACFAGGFLVATQVMAAKPLVHDGEYYFLQAQYKDAWDKEDKEIDAKLAELRKANGDKPPNIVFVLRSQLVDATSNL